MTWRTIDNLGVDVSTRYAEDKEVLDESLLKESVKIPLQTRVDVTELAYPSEFDTLFDLGAQRAPWASSEPPSSYFSNRRRLFSEQLIPSLGSLDKQELLTERIDKIPEDEEKVTIEKKVLLSLLKAVHSIDEQIIDSNGKRRQYTKG